MKQLYNALTSLDNLAPQLSLTYRKESRMKTPFGGTVVLAIYTVISLGFFYFSRDIIFKTNPMTKVNKVFRKDLTMPVERFPLFFLMTDKFVNPLKPGDALTNSLEIVIENWITQPKDGDIGATRMHTYRTMPCSEQYFKGYEHFYKLTVHPNALCVDYSKLYDYAGNEAEDPKTLFEYAETSDTSHLNIKIKACDEKKNPGCRKAFEDEGQLLLFMGYPTAVVNFDDYEEPVTHSLAFFQSSISPGLFLRKYSSFLVNEFVSDNGFILTDTYSETYVQTRIDDSDVMTFSEANRSLFAFTFKLDLIQERMERRYVKIQEILANVGGFTKALLLFATLLVKYFSEYSFFSQFGKEINLIAKRPNKPSLVNNLINESKNESKAQIASALNKATINVNVGFFAFIAGIFCKKTSLAAKEREKIFRYLDITFISGKLIEFEDRFASFNR